MKKAIALVAVLFSLSATAEDSNLPKEMYKPNEDGSYMVLTVENCAFPAATKKGFEYRSYVTLEDNSIKDEGCWLRPDISEAPQIPGVRIIPVVNLWFNDTILIFVQSEFTPDKRRWDVVKRDENR